MTDETTTQPRPVRQHTWLRVYRRCRHRYICLVNDGRLLHPTPTMDVCELGEVRDG